MKPADLERYLHEHIPLSACMQTRVLEVGSDGVLLAAPLAPNINHRETVFGGSASALAILAGWSLVHLRLVEAGVASRVVIQRNTIEYGAPILGDFTARSSFTDPGRWGEFLKVLERRGRARIGVSCALECDGVEAGRFEGDFVALDIKRLPTDG